jgi:AraC-like DNA-binding protein
MAETAARRRPLRHVEDRVHIRLLDLDFLRIDRSWNAGGVRSSFWRLYVNSRDGASVVLPTATYALAARRVHFVPAWVRWDCRCTRPIDHFYVHFDVVGLPGPLVRDVFDGPRTLAKDDALEAAAADVATALRERRRIGSDDDVDFDELPLSDVCRAKAMLYAAVTRLMESLPPDDAAHVDRVLAGPGPVRPAIRYIETHAGGAISNAELAALCGLSPAHFIRVFREAVGQTPAQYVLERRIASAAQRLIFGDEPIDAIADRTGFANRFHFTRAFTKRMGVAPGAYRKGSRV